MPKRLARIGKRSLFIFIATSMTAFVPASSPAAPTGSQVVEGHIVAPIENPTVARRSWVASEGSVNGAAGWVFGIDDTTQTGVFSLKQLEGTVRGTLRITFFEDVVLGDQCGSYSGADPITGVPCGTHGVVTLADGAGVDFLYEAHISAECGASPIGPHTVDPTGDPAVTFRIDAEHTGSVASNFQPTSGRRWCVDLGGRVSYPLIADEKVFVTVCHGTACSVEARDQLSGNLVWGPMDAGSTSYRFGLTYDSGRVFTLSDAGQLRGFDASTGASLWTTQLTGQGSFFGAPTAKNGFVYVQGGGVGGTVYAIAEETGAIAWSVDTIGGGEAAPTVTDDGVFVTYPGQHVYDLAPGTGDVIWHHEGDGYGGGTDVTPSVYNGLLYSRQYPDNLVFRTSDGSIAGGFAAGSFLAFADGRRFDVSDGTLRAVDLSSGRILWTFGDGLLLGAPIVSNGIVYVVARADDYAYAPATLIYGVDQEAGEELWRTSAPTGEAWNPKGVALGEGILAASGARTLSVF